MRKKRTQPFACVAIELIADEKVSYPAKMLYAAISFFQGGNSTSWASNKRLSEYSGVSYRHLKRYLRELERQGWLLITTENRKRHLTVLEVCNREGYVRKFDNKGKKIHHSGNDSSPERRPTVTSQENSFSPEEIETWEVPSESVDSKELARMEANGTDNEEIIEQEKYKKIGSAKNQTHLNIKSSSKEEKLAGDRIVDALRYFVKNCKSILGYSYRIESGKDHRLMKLILEYYEENSWMDDVDKWINAEYQDDLQNYLERVKSESQRSPPSIGDFYVYVNPRGVNYARKEGGESVDELIESVRREFFTKIENFKEEDENLMEDSWGLER